MIQVRRLGEDLAVAPQISADDVAGLAADGFRSIVRVSPLADSAGWLDVDPGKLRHRRHQNIHGLGDCINTSNAETAAAARKPAPVVARSVIDALCGHPASALHDGYGSCPLTVARGKSVLAGFAYGGELAPSFPARLLDGRRPTRAAWWLRERILPPLYWRSMPKGGQWMAQPKLVA